MKIFKKAAKNISAEIVKNADRSGLTICAAESCTGGLIGATLTEIPGASSVFLGSAVCYSNDAKTRILGVTQDILLQHGAVSGECAAAMAEGARNLFLADISLSITGIAGPGGGTADKPVGLVWFSVDSRRHKETFSCKFCGDRETIRFLAVATALETLLGVIGRDRYDS